MRGYNIDDYINKKFNNLTLIRNLNKIDKNNSKLALFKCDCGNVKELVFTQVLNGNVKSCGCMQGKLSDESKEKQRDRILNFHKSSKFKNNRTGHSGVSKVKDKYRVRICIHNKSIHLGYFENLEDAIKARKDAEIKYFDKELN